jgi:hypothetical protein
VRKSKFFGDMHVVCLFMCLVIISVGCDLQKNRETMKKEISVHHELFRDRDFLFERIQSMDDFDAVTYSESELNSLKLKPESKDYKHVLKSFVADKLNKEIDTYQSIDPLQESPFRTIVVTTKDQSVYRVSLKMMKDDYEGIWVVDMYGELLWKSYPVSEIEETPK